MKKLILFGMLSMLLAACVTAPAAVVTPDPTPPPAPSLAPGIYRVSDGALIEPAALFAALEDKKVVFVGESHDNAAHHEVERRVVEGLARRNPGAVALGMEMFQRPYQAPLDAYVREEIDEAALLAQTEYEDRWGFDFAFYRPMVSLMRLQGSRVVALNAPKELTRKISKVGLDGLTPEEAAQLPPTTREPSSEHRAMIKAVFDGFHSGMDEETFGRFYEAQLVWDATMGQSCVDHLLEHPETHQVVLLAGMFHVQYGLGIPRHVRLLAPDWETAIVIPAAPTPEEPVALEDFLGTTLGDYVWVIEP